MSSTVHTPELPEVRSSSLEDPERSQDETITDEELKARVGLTTFRGYVSLFRRILPLFPQRPGDAENALCISELLSQYDTLFEKLWDRPAETRIAAGDVNDGIYERLERASKFLLRLQNRKDISKLDKRGLHFLSKTLLRPLADRVQEVIRVRQHYTYSPLEYDPANGVRQIRTLCLLNNVGGNLCCRIEHVSLDSSPFKALSYEWGSSERLYWIEVVDKDGKPAGVIPLTNNLHSALCDLDNMGTSSEEEDRTYWIDQICVNQNDVAERSRQVGMMGIVYTVATRVISYLGPEDVYDGDGFELLEAAHAQYEPLYDSPMLDENFAETGLKYKDPRRVPQALRFAGKISGEAWQALGEFIFGPWTRRIWMVQETCLNSAASDVLMLRGNRTITWTRLAATCLVHWIGFLHRPDRSLQETFVDETAPLLMCWFIRTNLMKRDSPPGSDYRILDILLDGMGGMACSDPRDRVFALLGLATDAEALGIKADYSKSYGEVLLDVTVRMIQRRKNFTPLEYWTRENVHNTDTGQRLPSWVCRWPSRRGEGAVLRYNNATGGRMELNVRFSANHRCMHMSGIRIAIITHTLPGFDFDLTWPLNNVQLPQLESVIFTARAHLSRSIPHQPTADAALIRTLIEELDKLDMNNDGSQAINTLLGLIAIARRHLFELGCDTAEVNILDFNEELSEEQQELAWFIIGNARIKNRAIAFTDDGGICLAPPHARSGDIVALFGGGPNLYVVRPAGANYQYVGDAYMDGFMDGEATEKTGWEDTIETFSLI